MRAGRPRVRGNGRRQKKATASDKDGGAGAESKTRTSVNYRHKLNVIEYYLAHDRDASATVEHFYPTATKELRRRKMQLVSSWQKQHAKIRQHCESGMAHQRNVRHPGQGATLPREVEEQIVEWMYAQRRDGVKVTAKMLQQTARELAGECGFEEGVFTASWSWRDAFMKRHFRSPHAAPARQLSSPPDQPAAPQETESGTDDDAEPEPDVVEDGGDGEDADDAGDEPEKESDRAQVGDQEMPTSDTLATLLRENGLEQYLEVLRENGFETPASLAGIEEYFKELGVKLGHRKLFQHLSIRYTPGMEAMVPFVKVVIDIEAHFEWSKRCKFMAKSICRQWPKHVSVEVQNLFYGRITASADSFIGYSYKDAELSPNEPRRCNGEVVFSATLRDLYDAGYDIKDWKPFHHKLTLDKHDQ